MSGNERAGVYAPAADEDELVRRWLLRARESQTAHYERGVFFERWNFWFGIPVIIVTGIVSASVFAVVDEKATGELKIITMILSVLAVILSSLQTFLKFSEKAEQHRATGAEYGALRRRLELLHISSPKDKAALEKIGSDLSTLSGRAPSISVSIFKKTRRLNN